MTYSTLQLANDGRIATITLNRPDKRNAISYELIDDVTAALKQAAQSSAKVLILTGAGSAFSAGMDLENLKGLLGRTPEQNLEDSRTMAGLFRSLYDFPKPTIAAVNGAAIAGGTGLATLCDFTLAVPEAKFGYTEVRIGFVPGIVSSYLIANVGEKRARDLLLTGRLFSWRLSSWRTVRRRSKPQNACSPATLKSSLTASWSAPSGKMQPFARLRTSRKG